jgi:hypothetical protein
MLDRDCADVTVPVEIEKTNCIRDAKPAKAHRNAVCRSVARLGGAVPPRIWAIRAEKRQAPPPAASSIAKPSGRSLSRLLGYDFAQRHSSPQRHSGAHVQGCCATVPWQPQVQLDPTQGVQTHRFSLASFMTFSFRGLSGSASALYERLAALP